MMKSKKKLFAIGLIVVNALLAIFMVANVTYSIVSGLYNITETGMFVEDEAYEGETHTYKCYRITGEETKIAVAWGEEPEDATGTLKIPPAIWSDKPTGVNTKYDVVAIAKGGFARCEFTGVEVPQTVKEIKEGAFSYCHYLTSFQFPKDVTEIAASTFLDCRSLTSVYYSKEDGSKTLSGGSITTIGDHAFDSCVSLEKIKCPEAATLFKQSCFQNCKKLNEFRFPYDNQQAGDAHNLITVESYAFADCKDLHNVFFDVNMDEIAPYAFADSYTLLTFRYCGIVINDLVHPENNRDDCAAFDLAHPHWRNKYINTHGDYSGQLYQFIGNEKPVSESGEYPGLHYFLSSDDVPLDNARTDMTDNTTDVYLIQNAPKKYVVIDHFEIPEDHTFWSDSYYNEDASHNGTLTIPNTITINEVSYDVKIIRPYAFSTTLYDISNLKTIIFNQNLVQIQNHAFYHSNQIERLDFTACQNLKEISYALFNEVEVNQGYDKNDVISDGGREIDATETKKYRNKAMKSITLPNCLEYLGNLAFFNFTDLYQGIKFKTDENEAAHLKIIGDYAFGIYRDLSVGNSETTNNFTISGSNVKVVLPNSLDDAAAASARIYHTFAWDRKGNNGGSTTYPSVHASIDNRVAVNMNAFERQAVICSVEMEAHDAFGGELHETSFGASAFVRCPNIVRFKANKNICLIGTDIFKENKSLREVFLHADTSNTNSAGSAHPWGIADKGLGYRNGLFTGSNGDADYKNLVIYVQSSTGKAPKNQTDNWNVEVKGSFATDLYDSSYRPIIPTFFVDWDEPGNVKYWHINTTTDSLSNNGPTDLAGYNDGYMSLVKKSNNKFTVASYFTDGGSTHLPTREVVNLTSTTLTSESVIVDEIGPEAFGSTSINKGRFFILPSGVTTIRERAFYRTNANGVRIVTFAYDTNYAKIRKHGTYTDLTTFSSAAYLNTVTNTANGYCCLPTATTRVEKDAFYNHHFTSVDLSASLTYLGNGSFYTTRNGSPAAPYGVNLGFAFDDYDDNPATVPSNTYYTIINDAIYYTADANKKTLLHFPNGKTSLTVDKGTKAVGYKAAAGSKITSVTFDYDGGTPLAITTIYGYAFKNCSELLSLNNVSSIKYINAFPTDTSEEVLTRETSNSSNSLFDMYDNLISVGTDQSNRNARMGAFENCSKLKIDIEEFTSLVKVGYNAFKNCSVLAQTLKRSYKFYPSSDANTPATPTANVMDMSYMTQIRTLECGSFGACGITYAILPNTADSTSSASKLYYGTDDKSGQTVGKPFSNDTKVLCGEVGAQADEKGTGGLKPTTHYPNNSKDLTKFYYRVYSAADLLSGTWSTRRYWAPLTTGDPDDVRAVLFESWAEANAWLSVQANVDKIATTFPEV